MAYRDFTLKKVLDDFSLSLVEQPDFFGFAPSVKPSDELANLLEEYSPLALGVSTEKSRSEFIIAPILAEARKQAERKFSLFSGVQFNVEPERGLVGICDYILSRSIQQQFVSAPVFALVEAKNESFKIGLGQCVAEMVAAQIFNEREGNSITAIYGSVTIGTIWRFLKLENNEVTLDTREYYLERLDKILGILVHLATKG